MNILDYICLPFGYLVKWCYTLTGSYAIALFIFALVMKVILFPFGVKQQKNSIKQAKLYPKEQAIRKKYAGRNDQATQQKMQQEIMEFYNTEGYSPFGGCLPLLIQMPIILILYNVVRRPLTYVTRISSDVLAQLKPIAASILGTEVNRVDEINIISAMNSKPEAFSLFNIDVPNLNMFGVINLADTPNWSKLLTPIVLIPILVLITGYLQQFVIQKLSYNPSPETAKQMRTMNIFMPLMSVWFSFLFPAALGLYWSFQNILAMVQQFLLYKLYPIPVATEEDMKAAEKEYKSSQRQNVKVASKRHSIVYDDDDDIPTLPEKPAPKNNPEKNEQAQKTREANSIISPAPLKDDQNGKDKDDK